MLQASNRRPNLIEILVLQFYGAELEQRFGVVGLAFQYLAQGLRGEVEAIALAPHRGLLKQQAVYRRRLWRRNRLGIIWQ